MWPCVKAFERTSVRDGGWLMTVNGSGRRYRSFGLPYQKLPTSRMLPMVSSIDVILLTLLTNGLASFRALRSRMDIGIRLR
jgi:hypothetical protein